MKKSSLLLTLIVTLVLAFGPVVGVIMDQLGALLVADDVGNVIWGATTAP
jgi:hypothetical protein